MDILKKIVALLCFLFGSHVAFASSSVKLKIHSADCKKGVPSQIEMYAVVRVLTDVQPALALIRSPTLPLERLNFVLPRNFINPGRRELIRIRSPATFALCKIASASGSCVNICSDLTQIRIRSPTLLFKLW